VPPFDLESLTSECRLASQQTRLETDWCLRAKLQQFGLTTKRPCDLLSRRGGKKDDHKAVPARWTAPDIG
jgi:hypothetical protein